MCSLTGSAVGPGDAYARVRTEIIDAEAKKKNRNTQTEETFMYIYTHTCLKSTFNFIFKTADLEI